MFFLFSLLSGRPAKSFFRYFFVFRVTGSVGTFAPHNGKLETRTYVKLIFTNSVRLPELVCQNHVKSMSDCLGKVQILSDRGHPENLMQ